MATISIECYALITMRSAVNWRALHFFLYIHVYVYLYAGIHIYIYIVWNIISNSSSSSEAIKWWDRTVRSINDQLLNIQWLFASWEFCTWTKKGRWLSDCLPALVKLQLRVRIRIHGKIKSNQWLWQRFIICNYVKVSICN